MRKAGWILIMAFMALFLSACGAKLDAEAIVEAGGRGSREFTVSISKNDLKTLGNPSITEVDRVIKAAIPDCMTARDRDLETVRQFIGIFIEQFKPGNFHLRNAS